MTNDVNTGVRLIKCHCASVMWSGLSVKYQLAELLDQLLCYATPSATPCMCLSAYGRERIDIKLRANLLVLQLACSQSALHSTLHMWTSGRMWTYDLSVPPANRPVILPDYAELDLKIPDDARSPAWVCFDGKQVGSSADHIMRPCAFCLSCHNVEAL